MGDEPDLIPNPHYCSNSAFAGGMEPDEIAFSVNGTILSDDAPEGYPNPFNGSGIATWVMCNNWTMYEDPWNVSILVSETQSELLIWRQYWDISFWGQGAAESIITLHNLNTVPPLWWGNGIGIINAGLTDSAPPLSWDTAELVGIPKTADYLAEEMPISGIRRMNRFVSSKTKSNVLILR